MVVMFEDRVDAAKKLCPMLKQYKNNKETIIVGLTRGGVVVAKAISDFLKLKLTALVIKKIGAPGNSELAIGALASAKDVYWNKNLLEEVGISDWQKEYLASQREKEVKKLVRLLKIKPFEYKNKTTIVIDDGVATGATVIAAAKYLKRKKAKAIILAAPVISSDIVRDIKKYFDIVIFLSSVTDFYAVGEFYRSFEQISDEEVSRVLATSN